MPGIPADAAKRFVAANKAMGAELKWFGLAEPVAFTSSHHSWRYAGVQSLPETYRGLSGLFDMRIPLTFSISDCDMIGQIIAGCGARLGRRDAA